MKRATKTQILRQETHAISIHALVKRATIYKDNNIMLNKDFNPRPREEGDQVVIIYDNTVINFNPRPREEGDPLSVLVSSAIAISIHALVKRATSHLLPP